MYDSLNEVQISWSPLCSLFRISSLYYSCTVSVFQPGALYTLFWGSTVYFAVLSACLLFQRATRDGSGDLQQHAGSTEECWHQLRILTIASLSTSLTPSSTSTIHIDLVAPLDLHVVCSSTCCLQCFWNFSSHHSLLPMIVCVCIYPLLSLVLKHTLIVQNVNFHDCVILCKTPYSRESLCNSV